MIRMIVDCPSIDLLYFAIASNGIIAKHSSSNGNEWETVGAEDDQTEKEQEVNKADEKG